MTAIVVHTAANAVYVATDAAVYDRAGIVVDFEAKTGVVEHWPGAITGAGNAAAVPLVVDALSGAFATWDDMVSGAEEVLQRAADQWRLPSGADVILAGISAERGPECFTFRIDDSLPLTASREQADASKYWAERPFQIVRLGKLTMTPVPSDQVEPANWEGIPDDASDEIVEWCMRKLLTMQRQMELPAEIGGIGGFATLTKITTAGIEERVIARWPDQTGAPIRPGPINWPRWHRDHPRPRKRIDRREIARRRELTHQRIQMLGDLASVNDRVRLTEIALTQARMQPGNRITDADVQRIKDHARAQEELIRAQERLSLLGAAATDAERYAVAIQSLTLKLHENRISQNDFNRALIAAHPLFQPIKDAGSEFFSSFTRDVAHGTKAIDALRNSIGRLSDRLLDLASQQVFNVLFGAVTGTGPGGGGLISRLFGSADGNVFANGNVIPFARGGIVGGPTIFPMANGMGLMGEAGPEAVMPLRRTSSGRLGVEVAGGGGHSIAIAPTINVTMPLGAKPEDGRDFGDQIAKTLVPIVRAEIGKQIVSQKRCGGILA